MARNPASILQNLHKLRQIELLGDRCEIHNVREEHLR
jgi:hypothetical protein